MSAPVFSVVIPVFNNWELTRDCLQSLREHTSDVDFEVVVADNASSDATVRELLSLGETSFPGRFQRIRFEENRNFGPACNAGARAATAPLVFFLNNDTLLTPGWSAPLLEALRADDSLGAVGPLLLYPDNTVQHLGVTFTPTGVTHLYKGFPAEHPAVGKKRRLQFLTAAALLMPRDVFLDIGGFYEEYRNGFEDVELSIRIREKGKTLACVPTSRVYHLESKTPGRMNSEAEKHNSRLLAERYGNAFYIDEHHHGLRDGFQIRVNDWDDMSLPVAPEDSKALFASVAPNDLNGLVSLFNQNPYWFDGAERLAAECERNGLIPEALVFASRASAIHPTVAGYKRTLALAVRAKNTEVVESCGELLQKLLARHADKEGRCRFVKSIIHRARRFGDEYLENLYRERLAALEADLPVAG